RPPSETGRRVQSIPSAPPPSGQPSPGRSGAVAPAVALELTIIGPTGLEGAMGMDVTGADWDWPGATAPECQLPLNPAGSVSPVTWSVAVPRFSMMNV